MKPSLSFALALLVGNLTPLFAADFAPQNEAEFRPLFPPGAKVEQLATGMKFTEGPQWIPDGGGYLVFSDIPSDEIKKWSAKDGLATFRAPSGNANGNTLDHQGRVLSCEHTGRRVSATEKDGTVTTIADHFEGKRFNSPNDIVVQSNGVIWFTDPDYGLPNKPDSKEKEGKELPGNYVFRLEPKTGKITIAARDFDKPNGLCFSPDEKKLYIADSGKPNNIQVFDMQPDGTLSNGKFFCKIDKGTPDGLRCDTDGRVWASSGDGVQIFATDGHLIGRILLPESAANVCFGGQDMKTLFITARKSVYAVQVSVRGIR